MPDLVIAAALVLAVAVGIAGNRWWGRRERSAEDGLGLSDLANPVMTVTVVLLAFIMVEALSSFGRAREHAGTEARLVDQLAQAAVRVGDPVVARDLEGDLICYSRAVRFVEWPSMAIGGDRSQAATDWERRLEATLTDLRHGTGDAELERLIDLDGALGDVRLARLAEADPSIPTGLNWLMFLSVIVTLVALAVFFRPGGGLVVLAGFLVVFAVIVGGTLWMIYDLDRPFNGVNRIEPTELARTQLFVEGDFAQRFAGMALPCDAQGSPS